MVIPSEFEHEQIKKLESDKTKDQVVKKSPTRQKSHGRSPRLQKSEIQERFRVEVASSRRESY